MAPVPSAVRSRPGGEDPTDGPRVAPFLRPRGDPPWIRDEALVREGVVRPTPAPPGTPHRLGDGARAAMRLRHFSHVLNRGPAGVQSPADRLLGG